MSVFCRLSSRRMFIIIAVFVATTLPQGFLGKGGTVAAKEPPTTIKLVIDYGDNVQKQFTAIAWKNEMTVADAMSAAAKHPRGIRYESRGSGATLFLFKIDDLKNEGFGKNWLFYVNGKTGDASFGVTKLSAGDEVLWKFGEYLQNK